MEQYVNRKMMRLETFFAVCYINGMDSVQIKAWRKSLGWSQEKAGQALGISRSTVIRYEHGGEIPSPEMLELAAERLAQIHTGEE